MTEPIFAGVEDTVVALRIEQNSIGLRRLRPSVLALPAMGVLGVTSDYLTCTFRNGSLLEKQGFYDNIICGCTDAAIETWEGPAEDPILNCQPKSTVVSTVSTVASTVTPAATDVVPGAKPSRSSSPAVAVGVSVGIVCVVAALVVVVVLYQRYVDCVVYNTCRGAEGVSNCCSAAVQRAV